MSVPTPMPTPMPISNSVLEKATLTVPKLQGWEDWHHWSTTIQIVLDHTWEYVPGDKKDAPDMKDPDHANWIIEDHNACWRIWLALSENIQDTVLLHTNSHASELFQALKLTYEYTGIAAEYYAHLDYDNAKVSDYDNLHDFITGLVNQAHLVNREVQSSDGQIQQ